MKIKGSKYTRIVKVFKFNDKYSFAEVRYLNKKMKTKRRSYRVYITEKYFMITWANYEDGDIEKKEGHRITYRNYDYKQWRTFEDFIRHARTEITANLLMNL